MNGSIILYLILTERRSLTVVSKEMQSTLYTRNKYWDGHYFTFNPLPGDIIDVASRKQLPTNDIVVNMDGGVGGSWKELTTLKLMVNV